MPEEMSTHSNMTIKNNYSQIHTSAFNYFGMNKEGKCLKKRP